MMDACVMTGAGSGIGLATALRLAEMRIPLVLVGRPDSLAKTQDQVMQRGGRADIVSCDLADYAKIRGLVAGAIPVARRLGVVLAASQLGPSGSDCPLEAYDEVYRINVLGNLAVVQACLPGMIAAHFGRVVFFAGGGAAYAYPEFPAYALSKVSTVRLVENLAATYRAHPGLSFACLAPGAVSTPMLARVLAAGGEVKTKTNIAEPVRFIEQYLLSDSAALNGRYVHVRDHWPELLAGKAALSADQFYLRRIS